MDVKARLDLAGQNLLQCLCPEENYLPYWYMVIDENFSAEYRFRPRCNGHNVGRWWNAMLRLEDCNGFEIPPDIEQAMLETSWRMSANPSGIFLEDIDAADASRWYLHSYRETMLSFGLLVKYRSSQTAYQCGLRAIEQMRHASQNLDQWDFSFGAGAEHMLVPARHAYTHGRAIEGLLCFYEATGESSALEEAERLAQFHFAHTVNADGSLAAGCGHHTHSYLNTIRGLLLMAALQGRRDQLDVIYATYKNAIAQMITRSGFVTHDIGSKHGGDIASAGDIAHIALILSDHFGASQLLDDVERIARARLLPAQVLAPMPVRAREDEDRDSYRDLGARFVGSIGGDVGHVKGQTCVTDYTASAMHTLIEIINRTVDIDDKYVRVNFHLDCDTPAARVRSGRDGTAAHVSVRHATGKDLRVRIPGWVEDSTLNVRVNDRAVEANLQDGFLVVGRENGALQVDIDYSLPEYEVEEVWRDEFATQECVTFKWRGDEIYEVAPVGRYLEPFPKKCG